MRISVALLSIGLAACATYMQVNGHDPQLLWIGACVAAMWVVT